MRFIIFLFFCSCNPKSVDNGDRHVEMTGLILSHFRNLKNNRRSAVGGYVNDITYSQYYVTLSEVNRLSFVSGEGIKPLQKKLKNRF